MAELIELPGTRPVNEGERRVVNALAERLPSEYSVIPNLEVKDQGTRRYFEIDAIVVAPHAVYVVEVKDWKRAEITGDDKTWTVSRRTQRNPVGLTRTKAKVVRSLIVQVHRPLEAMWVQETVVLARRPRTVDLRDGGDDFLYESVDSLIEFILDPSALPGRPFKAKGAVEKVVEVLVGAQIPSDESQRRIASWELGEILDETETSVTYQAIDVRTDLAAVVRVVYISPYVYGTGPEQEQIARLRRDFVALERMGPHPNIVGTVDAFEDDLGNQVLVSKPVEGMNLRLWVAADQTTTDADRLRIARGLTAALAHAHTNGVLHRRVAAENVIVRTDGEPMLTNFDFARIVELSTITKPRSALDVDEGYVAPEVFDPSLGEVTAATDWFGLACVIWSLWEGAPPFSGSPTRRHYPVGRPSRLPGHMFTALSGFLARRPEERHGSLEQVLRVCDQLAEPTAQTRGPLVVGAWINNRYLIEEVLGSGSSAEVFRVSDPPWEDIAVKVYRDHIGFDDVKREFAALNALEHPNIVQVIDVDTADTDPPRYFIKMKVADGVSLFDHATRGGIRLDPDRVITIGRQILSALAAIHPVGDEPDDRSVDEARRLTAGSYIHRDIKPEHVFVGADDHVTLIDFNIATLAGSDELAMQGTIDYQPPDSTGDPWDVDIDLFATGVVLFELACGEHPYLDRRPKTSSFRPAATINADLPHALGAFLDKACSSQRSDRFDSALDMLAALDRTVATSEPAAHEITAIGLSNVTVTPDVFVDRDDERALARDHLRGEGRPVFVVTGDGGTGKSQLAAHIATELLDERAVEQAWWITSENDVATVNSLCKVAALAGTPEHSDDQVTARAFRDSIVAARGRCLLVFDNAPDPDTIAEWVPRAGATVLVTSRASEGWRRWDGAVPLALGPFPDDDAARLIEQRIGWIDFADAQRIIAGIKHKVELFPFVLRGVCARIAVSKLSADQYLSRFGSDPITMVSTGDDDDVVSDWAKTITDLDEASRELLGVCAWLDPDQMPIDPIVGRGSTIDIAREDLVQQHLGLLVDVGFIQPTDDVYFRMHRLLQLLVRLEVDRDRQCLRRAVEHTVASFPTGVLIPKNAERLDRIGPSLVRVLDAVYDAIDANELVPDRDLRNVLARGCRLASSWLRNWASEKEGARLSRRGAGHLADTDDVEAGRLLYELSLFGGRLAATKHAADEEALRLRSQAVDRLRSAGEAGAPYLPGVVARLGIRVASSDRQAGERLLDEARRALDEGQVSEIERGNILGMLSEYAIKVGEFEKAESYSRQAVEVLDNADIGPHRTRIRCIADLARALRRRGDVRGALVLYQRALELFEEAMHGRPRSSTTLASRVSDYGYVLREAGHLRESLDLLRRALRISEELGASQPTMAIRISTLGLTLGYLGDYNEAERMLKQALEISANAEPRRWAIRARNWGLYLNHRLGIGDLAVDENVAWARDSVAVHRLALRALAMSNVRAEWQPLTQRDLCAALVFAGELDEAKPLVEASITELAAFYGPEHPETAIAHLVSARLADRQGDEETVRAQATIAAEIFAKTFGPLTSDLQLPLYSEAIRLSDTRSH